VPPTNLWHERFTSLGLKPIERLPPCTAELQTVLDVAQVDICV
jgi:hypothetical protein